MNPEYTFLWHQLYSAHWHKEGHSALAAQRKGWPLLEVDRKTKMKLEGFTEEATLELGQSAYAVLISYKGGREGEHSLVRKKVWPLPVQCSCLFHWSPMALSPSQGHLGKIVGAKVTVCQIPFEVLHAHLLLTTEIYEVGISPIFVIVETGAQVKFAQHHRKEVKREWGLWKPLEDVPWNSPRDMHILHKRLMWDRTPSPHPLSPRSKEIVETHICQVLIPTQVAMWCFNSLSWVILTRSLWTTDHFLQFVDEYLCLVPFQDLLTFPQLAPSKVRVQSKIFSLQSPFSFVIFYIIWHNDHDGKGK